MPPDPQRNLTRAEILDWRDEVRLRVRDECHAAFLATLESAQQRVRSLSTADLLLPRSSERRATQQYLVDEVSALADRLSRMLQLSVERSLGEVEHRTDYGGIALLTAGGATAVGALGAAGFATVLAGSTTTVGFWIFAVPVATFSWPVFTAVAAGAGALAFASGRIRSAAAERMRRRFVAASESWLRYAILESRPKGPPAIGPHLLAEIDRIASQRLESI